MTAPLSSGLIMVHVQNESAAGRLVTLAAPLAGRTAARMVGLHIMPPVHIYADAAIAAGADYMTTQQAFHREDAENARQAFETATAEAGASGDWLQLNGGTRSMISVAAGACRVADLVVMTQLSPDTDVGPMINPANLVLECGRPVLIVPTAGSYKSVGERVLVAWNGTREASRALFDGLPLVRQGADVRILSIGRDVLDEESYLSNDVVAKSLEGRGFSVEAHHSNPGRVGVDDELLSRAADFGADLIIMGCYGHTRLRETIFGGATAGILAHMTAPVLMSH